MFKKKTVFLFLMVAITVLAVALAGCGTNNDNGNGNGDNGNGDNGNGEPTEDASLERVLDEGTFHVAGSGLYPPFNFFDDEAFEVAGFDVDTGRAIAERLGVDLNYITTSWDGITEGLRAGRYDAVLGSMAITADRLEVVNFTIPYYYSGAQLVVLNDSGITDPSEMEGKTIAVVTGTTFEDDALDLGAEVALYEGDTETLMELLNGRVDGVITDRLVIVRAMQEMPGGERLALAGELLRLEEMALAVNQNDEALLDELNSILQEMHDDGTLSQISREWFDGMDITVE